MFLVFMVSSQSEYFYGIMRHERSEYPEKRGYIEHMKTTMAAIDFGTSKIVTMQAESSLNQRCDIIGTGYAYYDGFSKAEGWHNTTTLNAAIEKSVKEAEDQSGRRITEANVGVPGAFSTVYVVEVQQTIKGTEPRITLSDIKMLFKTASEKLSQIEDAVNEKGELKGIVIHRSPAWFSVDDHKRTMEPIGMKGSELKARISFVLADKSFLDEVDGRLRGMGISVSGFFSTITGEALLYIPEDERDRISVLIDIGYLSTDVIISEGDAVIYLNTIPIGGGYITMDLADGLRIQMDIAEQLKRSYVFGQMSSHEKQYTVTMSNNAATASFAHDKVAEILEPRVDELAESIQKSLDDSGIRLSQWSVIYLTGGGLFLNRGGKDYLAGKLNRLVRETPKRVLKLDSPVYASVTGLLDLIVDTMEQQKAPSPGLAGKFKDFFRSLMGG